MSGTYYLQAEQELIRLNIREGEIAIYTGTVRDGLRSGPGAINERHRAYVYRWAEDHEEGISADFETDSWKTSVLDFTTGEDHYVFIRSETGTYLRQILGPVKPIVVGNIGAEAIRVDTPLGKFMIPAGTVFRLDQSAPLQRKRRKVLLNFARRANWRSPLESALLLEGGRWKPLNICLSGYETQVKDGVFAVLTLTHHGFVDVELYAPPDDPDYEIYFRRTMDCPVNLHLTGMHIKDEGLTSARRKIVLAQDVIYDLQKLIQAPTAALIGQCTADLPGLDAVSDPPEQDIPWPKPPEDKTDVIAGFEPFGWPEPPDDGT